MCYSLKTLLSHAAHLGGQSNSIPVRGEEEPSEGVDASIQTPKDEEILGNQLNEQHLSFQENQKGVTFKTLFGPYLKGASKITITDPYIRLFYQARNVMELLESIAESKSPEEEVKVHLITTLDEQKGKQQIEYFEQMQINCGPAGVDFSWEFDGTNTIHARHIIIDTGWKILLDRGLDIYQQYDMNDAFALNNRLQEYRSCKAFEVTYLKLNAVGA